ncbi:MAG: hypothetical protein RBS73_08900 [Prolixibacteraceae bacterium]|nr:hypothetical protein [Prolixibacteraceae bacterium]
MQQYSTNTINIRINYGSNSIVSGNRGLMPIEANEETARKWQRYFKEKCNGYGLSTTQIQNKVDNL